MSYPCGDCGTLVNLHGIFPCELDGTTHDDRRCMKLVKNQRDTQRVSDKDLAIILIIRLNALIKNDDIRKDITTLFEQRIECSDATKNHDTIQIGVNSKLGTLGLLNGLVGVIEEGPKQGWGYLTAVY